MTKRWLGGGAVLATLIILAQPQQARADMKWIAYYPGAVINWYDGPFPFLWSWQNMHFPARDSYMTYGVGDYTYKIYYPSPTATGKYYYLTPKAGIPVEDTTAVIEVRVPQSDADVWFQGERTSRTGTVRQFRTPPLVVGRNYTYDILAFWGVGGAGTKELRKVPVKSGDRITVDFNVPAR